MKRVIFLVYLFNVMLHGMEREDGFFHNTYDGIVITPQTLLALAPRMPEELEQETDLFMNKHQTFISHIVTTPHPLTHENRKKKTETNKALIEDYEQKDIARNLSNFNYVLKFSGHDFTVPINRWGSRVAYLVYASGQGSVLDPNFKPDFDCSMCEYITSYQHCSRVAHYLRFTEIAKKKRFESLKTTPTYLKHIPNKPDSLSDEHYVVVQEWVDNLKEINQLPEREQSAVIKNITPSALKEIYEATVYAALWDISGNLAVNVDDNSYYIVDLEEPFNHKPQFFFFQGEEGREKYVLDVRDGLQKMSKKLQNEPELHQLWGRFVEEDNQLQKMLKEYNIVLDLQKYDTD